MDYTKLGVNTATESGIGFDAGLRTYMVRVYKYMCLALVITGAAAFFAGTNEAFLNLMFTQTETGFKPSGLYYIVAFSPLAPWAVYFFSQGRLSYQATHAILWSFALLMGLSMFTLVVTYTGASIARVFFITSALFGGMAFYGYTTKKDLTKIGSFLIMGMWGIFVASIVNIFLASSALYFAISIIGVVIFTGLTAYENQQLKQIYFSVAGDKEAEGKTAVFGAMTLYITFINLFIMLLRLIGDRR